MYYLVFAIKENQVRKLIKKIESLVRKEEWTRRAQKSDGYWDDRWVGPRFLAKLKPVQEFQKFRLEGWRPEDFPSASVSISLEGREICSQEVQGGFFVIEGQAPFPNKDELSLEILTSYSTSPTNDLRDLSFVIKRLDFL